MTADGAGDRDAPDAAGVGAAPRAACPGGGVAYGRGPGARIDRVPTRLSGGEQQRVAVVMALANRPALLLADEPTGELDTAAAREIDALFRDLVRGYALTILSVQHDPSIAAHLDRVVSIRDGKTSTETIRVARKAVVPALARSEAGLVEHDAEVTDDTYSEYVVADSVGRLEIPQELREAYR